MRLDLSDVQGSFTLKWLDISNTRWIGEKPLQGGRPVEIAAPGDGGTIELKAPGPGQWAVLVTAQQ